MFSDEPKLFCFVCVHIFAIDLWIKSSNFGNLGRRTLLFFLVDHNNNIYVTFWTDCIDFRFKLGKSVFCAHATCSLCYDFVVVVAVVIVIGSCWTFNKRWLMNELIVNNEVFMRQNRMNCSRWLLCLLCGGSGAIVPSITFIVILILFYIGLAESHPKACYFWFWFEQSILNYIISNQRN